MNALPRYRALLAQYEACIYSHHWDADRQASLAREMAALVDRMPQGERGEVLRAQVEMYQKHLEEIPNV
jgi:hypothetical protein